MAWLDFGLSAFNGVFGAAASALSAEQNWKYKQKEMALQQQYAVENYQRQLADQERLLAEQRAYDSPVAVAERYRAGGISPLAAFGGSVVGQTAMSSVPSVAAPSASGSYGQPIPVPDLLQAKKIGADVEKTEAETKSILGETDPQKLAMALQRLELELGSADLENKRLLNSFQRTANDIQEALKDTTIESGKVSLETQKQTLRNLQKDFEYQDEMIRKLIVDREVSEESKRLIVAQTAKETLGAVILAIEAKYADRMKAQELSNLRDLGNLLFQQGRVEAATADMTEWQRDVMNLLRPDLVEFEKKMMELKRTLPEKEFELAEKKYRAELWNGIGRTLLGAAAVGISAAALIRRGSKAGGYPQMPYGDFNLPMYGSNGEYTFAD